MSDEYEPGQWDWMMKWCVTNRVPCANAYWWDQAENAYREWREQQKGGGE